MEVGEVRFEPRSVLISCCLWLFCGRTKSGTGRKIWLERIDREGTLGGKVAAWAKAQMGKAGGRPGVNQSRWRGSDLLNSRT